jgi:hypothetical protein
VLHLKFPQNPSLLEQAYNFARARSYTFVAGHSWSIHLRRLFKYIFHFNKNQLQASCSSSINIKRLKVVHISIFCNVLNWTSTFEDHICLVRTPFWLVQVFLESLVSLLSYATDFSSIGFVVCEICSQHRSLFLIVTVISVASSKNHSYLIWTPLGMNVISKWRIGSLVSYATGFTSIRFVVWEISSIYRRSPETELNRGGWTTTLLEQGFFSARAACSSKHCFMLGQERDLSKNGPCSSMNSFVLEQDTV